MTAARIGIGLDVHAFSTEAGPLVLGGVEVPGAEGLAGHTDADVVVHALIDALLGATAAGDLGSRFGTSDPALEDASSLELLTAVVEDLTGAGHAIANIDLTVVAQRPRLGAHRDEIRLRLAGTVGVSPDQVSVKITSTDGLGSIGRGEGIACWAACTVTSP